MQPLSPIAMYTVILPILIDECSFLAYEITTLKLTDNQLVSADMEFLLCLHWTNILTTPLGLHLATVAGSLLDCSFPDRTDLSSTGNNFYFVYPDI